LIFNILKNLNMIIMKIQILKPAVLLTLFLIIANFSFAQLGINSTGNPPDATAMLDVSSTSKGLLIPRMTSQQRTALPTADGLTVYDTDTHSFWYFSSGLANWSELSIGNQWLNNGLNMYNANTGNVGIGTSLPVTKLDINATSQNVAKFNGTSGMYISIYEDNIYRGYWGSYAGNAEDVDFGTGSGTNGKLHLTIKASPKMTIDNLGNVGIGTQNPAHKLDVLGNLNTTGQVLLNGSAGTTGQVLTSNGVAAPTWTNAAFTNTTRFAATYANSTFSGTSLTLAGLIYNTNPSDITVAAGGITINKAGLYHLNGTYDGRLSASVGVAHAGASFFISPYFTLAYDTPMYLMYAYSQYGLLGAFNQDIYISAVPATISFSGEILYDGAPTSISRSITIYGYRISD
jgi:hypothetical protein